MSAAMEVNSSQAGIFLVALVIFLFTLPLPKCVEFFTRFWTRLIVDTTTWLVEESPRGLLTGLTADDFNMSRLSVRYSISHDVSY